MEIDLIRGLITAVLFLAFVVLIFFTWSRKRAKTFDEAARMPLEDNERPISPEEQPR